MNIHTEFDRNAYFLFMKNHWSRLKAEGLTTSFALTYLHNMWKCLSEDEKNKWRSDAMVADMTQILSDLNLQT